MFMWPIKLPPFNFLILFLLGFELYDLNADSVVDSLEMSNSLLVLTEDDVKSAIDWNSLFNAIVQVMADVSMKASSGDSSVIQPPRIFTEMPTRKGLIAPMIGFSERKNLLACKMVTAFPDNPRNHSLPSILANVLLFDPDTGKLKAILGGTTITEWRTAAASAVATHYLKPGAGKDQTLAVFGAGAQGRIHIVAFQHYFKFSKVKLWNRTYAKGLKLARELKSEHDIEVEVCERAGDCAKDADVIVTATHSSEPIIEFDQLKNNVMINAVGAGVNHHSELGKSIYRRSSIYTDSMENARVELKGLIDEGFQVLGEVGEIINGQKEVTKSEAIVFHSLGMALEDGVAAQLVLEKYAKEKNIRI